MSKDAANSKSRKDTILVVEDDRALRNGLAMNLELHGYHVLTASDGEKGMQLAFDARPELIVLDIMLPGWTGLDILEELRKRNENVPVLILSARNTTADKVTGLDLGADDYMAKPFDLPELIARIEVMLRRQRSEERDRPVLSAGELTIDQAARTVEVCGANTSLSAKEFDILCLLAESPGKVFSRETILERVWGWDYDGTARTVDNFVASLRKKLETDRPVRARICTVPRVGYKIEVQLRDGASED
ncbi:Response regulator ArlR [Pontiella desulfatans]|uniref:Phosphate regulon transcriptional regulatory protein PhoB n=1 Tax=Pontiella desulfatans TaxID=2750659 RepID=A0A6C2U933_PONDE|nr:response regulator transcription factor [Pontiella desulfatans]VGO16622.1 Response regulator ArlR [Pontiella desulfatans]